nr:hypothetical protein [Mucilaginibacter sp. X4EP1]
MKLGKLNPVHDSDTPQLANYLNLHTLPAAPAQYSYTGDITTWGMMNNDKIGNCTCAAAGHLIMEWTASNGKMVTPTDADIISAYAAITGYNPATGANDGGAGVKEALNYWRKTGIAGHRIMGYAALEPQNHQYVMQSVYLFGGCYVGLSLPATAKTQLVWDVSATGTQGDGASGSWGGHVVPVVGYDANGLTIVTWGYTKTMTWNFWNAYCDESYAIISVDFTTNKVAPNGFDLVSLKRDLQKISS